MSEVVYQPYFNYGAGVSKWIQAGGAAMRLGKLEIDIREAINTRGSLTIYGGRQENRRPCFEMTIDGSEATLQSLEAGTDCFISQGGTSKDLVRFAYRIAKDHGCKSLTLTDISYIKCPEPVNLADLSFITTGKTWYQSILPFKIQNFKKFPAMVKKMKTVTWGEMKKKFEMLGNKIPPTVTADDDVPAMKVFQAMKESQEYCDFFNENMIALLAACGIRSLYGTSWKVTI